VKDVKVDNIKESISETLQLPKEIILDVPRITIVGEKDLYIENHKGILQYSKEMIRVKGKNNIIKIQGENLLIKIIMPEEIVINGKINAIEFDYRGV